MTFGTTEVHTIAVFRQKAMNAIYLRVTAVSHRVDHNLCQNVSFAGVKGITDRACITAEFAPSDEGGTCHFLSLTTADIIIIATLYQTSLWRSQTCWKT